MDRNKDFGKFSEAIGRLVAAYPNCRLDPKHVDAFWYSLQFHALVDVVEACRQAPAKYPQWCPTAGQLGELVRNAEKGRRLAEKPAGIPVSPEKREEYVLSADSPWEKLARIWEVESKTLRIDPDKQSPEEVQKRRMGDFWKMWTKHVDEKVCAL